MSDSPQFLLCVARPNDDLQVLKVYRRIADPAAEEHGLVRIVDDSGEDYLYPRAAFLSLPDSLEAQLAALAPVSGRD